MPRYDLDRDGFVKRIDRRRRWAHRRFWALSQFGAPVRPLQAAVYDAAFRSDAEAVAYHYARVNDHMPDLRVPTWINEKVRWQFLHHPNPLMSLAADKIAAREYLRLKGAQVPPPNLIATGSDPCDLAVVALPARFVLKSAYGSGQNHFETGATPSSRRELVAKAAIWREWDQWRHTGEMHYRDVPKRWLVEEYLPAEQEKLEFKFFCVQGEPVFCTVVTERSASGLRRAVYDANWKRVAIAPAGADHDPRPVPRPPELDLMLAEARRLSEDFLHVRVDFLKFDGRLAFSELTFANLAARLPFAPLEANRELGALMDLRRAPDYLAHGRRIAETLGWRAAA